MTKNMILLIEDNQAHAELIIRTVEDNAFDASIRHLTDGEKALDYLLRRGRYADPNLSPRPSAILLDLRLPRVDGIEVLRHIKHQETTRHIPVVVLTTSNAERDIKAAYRNYANSYLVKPVEFERLNRMLHDVSRYWVTWNTELRG